MNLCERDKALDLLEVFGKKIYVKYIALWLFENWQFVELGTSNLLNIWDGIPTKIV